VITLSSGSATDVGRVRQSNEDSVLVAAPVFAVADGMGGYAGGAVASSIAVVHLRRLSELAEVTSDAVYAALIEANHEIVERGQSDPETLGMGTTVAGLALVQHGGSEYWLVFNVGDSRVYRLTEGSLTQVSVDHSYTQELVDEGRITVEQAMTHPERNVVTRALGSEPDVAPDLWLMAPEDGELFLLCSDGLTRELSVSDMEDVLGRSMDAQAACDELLSAALAAGGRDNISVVVVQVGAPSAGFEPDEATAPPSSVRQSAHEVGVQQSEPQADAGSVIPDRDVKPMHEVPAATPDGVDPVADETVGIITAVPADEQVSDMPRGGHTAPLIEEIPSG